MLKRIRYYVAKLTRLHHSLGFGVQSPTDYSFIREVINERSDYYQHDEIGEWDDWITQKLGRLYFRIANWRQPDVIESYDYKEYLRGGCRQASFGRSTELIFLPIDIEGENLLSVLDRTDDNTVLVVEGIHDGFKAKKIWHKIVEDERARVCFDLYLCGIVMFDKRRSKIDYVVNF